MSNVVKNAITAKNSTSDGKKLVIQKIDTDEQFHDRVEKYIAAQRLHDRKLTKPQAVVELTKLGLASLNF